MSGSYRFSQLTTHLPLRPYYPFRNSIACLETNESLELLSQFLGHVCEFFSIDTASYRNHFDFLTKT